VIVDWNNVKIENACRKRNDEVLSFEVDVTQD
jgi:hypothetical protein